MLGVAVGRLCNPRLGGRFAGLGRTVGLPPAQRRLNLGAQLRKLLTNLPVRFNVRRSLFGRAPLPRLRLLTAKLFADDRYQEYLRSAETERQRFADLQRSLDEARRSQAAAEEAMGAQAKRLAEVQKQRDMVREEALPYAAAVPELPLSPANELPWVEFHKVEGPLPQGVEAAWLVVWEGAVFVAIVGERGAVCGFETGARLVGSSGETLGNLVRAEARLAELLFPPGAAPGRHVLVLQCDRSAGELAARRFAIPGLADRGIRLVPKEPTRSQPDDLVADLVRRNRLSRFLASLPAEVESPEKALTLSFYLRLLIHQGRLTPGEARRLAALPWLTPDLKAALQRGRGTEEDDPPE